MKKNYLFFVFAAILGFIGWQWGQHWVPAAQAAPNCTIIITKFDSKTYNAEFLDTILNKNGLITQDAFLDALKAGALPFTTNKASEEIINEVMDKISVDVCQGKCSPDYLVMQSSCGASCAINITKFDPKTYNAKVLDTILYQNGLITQDAFLDALQTGALPFTTNKASEQIINVVMDIVTKEVCKGKCNSDYLVMQSSCGAGCAINITKFDFKEYSPHPVDDILFTYHFIDPGDFLRAVQNGQLPFLTKTLSENDATLAISDIKEALCGMPDKCNPAALVLDLQCIKPDNSSTSPFERARAARVERLAVMNTCQKQVFQAMQANNEQYLKSVKENNQQYYSAMAPITAQFRRDYFATKDPGVRQSLLQNYLNQNKTNRQKLYKSQAKSVDNFLGQVNILNSQFNACVK